MDHWVFSLVFSSSISLLILKTTGPWINMDREYLFTQVEQFSVYDYICKILTLYLCFDNPTALDYKIHHFVNLWGIVWCYYQNKYFGFVKTLMFYEMTTPWLSLYMITKNKYTVPMILFTYMYYRVYVSLAIVRYIFEIDMVLKIVGLTNTALNMYWFSKILRKCYVKLLQ